VSIHREGRKFFVFSTIFYSIFLLLIFPVQKFSTSFILLSATYVLSIGFFTVFFRVPNRTIKNDQSKVLSPCDGKVVIIEKVDYPAFGEGAQAIQISIFMHLYNVHVNKMPVSGKIIKVQHTPGKFLPAFRPKSSELNEHCLICVQTEESRVDFKQIAGAVAKRIRTFCKVGEQLKQGDEMGFILFGSRLDVFLPSSFKVDCSLGQKVKGGISTLANIG
jgi:phosphatidylserine decarboxylase|tara:strand:- start:4222 stop:4878 length:657 start_codon:yes stop_codon:yes gene_type:complete